MVFTRENNVAIGSVGAGYDISIQLDAKYCNSKYQPLTPWLKRGACAAHLVTVVQVAPVRATVFDVVLPDLADGQCGDLVSFPLFVGFCRSQRSAHGVSHFLQKPTVEVERLEWRKT